MSNHFIYTINNLFLIKSFTSKSVRRRLNFHPDLTYFLERETNTHLLELLLFHPVTRPDIFPGLFRIGRHPLKGETFNYFLCVLTGKSFCCINKPRQQEIISENKKETPQQGLQEIYGELILCVTCFLFVDLKNKSLVLV